jgi:hypothetical protein
MLASSGAKKLASLLYARVLYDTILHQPHITCWNVFITFPSKQNHNAKNYNDKAVEEGVSELVSSSFEFSLPANHRSTFQAWTLYNIELRWNAPLST